MKRSLSIPARLSELTTLRNAIADFTSGSLNEIEQGRVILAVDEAVSNVIIHGYNYDESKIVEIDMEYDHGSFIFTISDSAREYNPLENASPDIEGYSENGLSSGLGVDVYRRIMNVRYERTAQGVNRLILIKEKYNDEK